MKPSNKAKKAFSRKFSMADWSFLCSQLSFLLALEESLPSAEVAAAKLLSLVSEKDQKEASEDEREEWVHLGNAGEPCNLDYAWIQQVRLDPAQDYKLLCLFAEARGAGQDTLWK